MSKFRFGITCCACALCVTLPGCSGSQSTVSSEDSVSATVDSDQAPVGDDPADQIQVGLLLDSDEALVSLGPEGDSSVMFDAIRYPLDSALGDIWGVVEDHYNVDFTLTDGKFLLSPTNVNGVEHSLLVPVRATAIVYAELYSPGDSLSFVTYSYSAFSNDGGVLAGNAYFDQAYIGVDTDNSGDVENDEQLQVMGGTIEFTGKLPDIELRFSVTLENGEMAEGHYTGLFDFADRQ